MENLKITGMVHTIGTEQQISASFKKRELIIETSGQYPQHILVQFSQDKCDLINNLKVGDSVTVSVNLRGKLWNDKNTGAIRCFNTLDAWTIELAKPVVGSFAPSEKPIMEKAVVNYPETPKQVEKPVQKSILDDESDDLPF